MHEISCTRHTRLTGRNLGILMWMFNDSIPSSLCGCRLMLSCISGACLFALEMCTSTTSLVIVTCELMAFACLRCKRRPKTIHSMSTLLLYGKMSFSDSWKLTHIKQHPSTIASSDLSPVMLPVSVSQKGFRHRSSHISSTGPT